MIPLIFLGFWCIKYSRYSSGKLHEIHVWKNGIAPRDAKQRTMISNAERHVEYNRKNILMLRGDRSSLTFNILDNYPHTKFTQNNQLKKDTKQWRLDWRHRDNQHKMTDQSTNCWIVNSYQLRNIAFIRFISRYYAA